MRAALLLVLLPVPALAGSCAAPTVGRPAERKAAAMSDAAEIERGWVAATGVVSAHFKARTGRDPVQVSRGALRYALSVELTADTWETVLVHRGHVVSGGGLTALAGYLADAGFPQRRELDLRNLTELLHFYDAYPTDVPDRRGYFPAGGLMTRSPELAPRLAWNDDGSACLVLHYNQPQQVSRDEGPSRGPTLFLRATLWIPLDRKLRWAVESIPIAAAPTKR